MGAVAASQHRYFHLVHMNFLILEC
jgi:hypothetical protein